MNAACQNPRRRTSPHNPGQRTFTKGCWNHGSASHEFVQCDTFSRLEDDALGVDAGQRERPSVKINLLMGVNYSVLLPRVEETRRSSVDKSRFVCEDIWVQPREDLMQ